MKNNTEKVLSNGVKIPMRGFGVYQIQGKENTKKAVREAIDVGYRLFDTARAYGNEDAVGEAIRESGLPREEFFVTSKVWTSGAGYEAAEEAFENTLRRMKFDYLDMYLIHEPMGDYYGTWRALEEEYRKGRIRVIGVCNFWPDRLLDFCLNNEIAPQLTQIETHPFQHQKAIQTVLRRFNIAHEAWAPFAEGREGIFDSRSSNNQLLAPIAKAHGKSVAQVILRWLYQRDIVTLSKSTHQERMEENFDILDFELTQEEMEVFDLMDHERPLILNNRDLEVVTRISPANMAGIER